MHLGSVANITAGSQAAPSLQPVWCPDPAGTRRGKRRAPPCAQGTGPREAPSAGKGHTGGWPSRFLTKARNSPQGRGYKTWGSRECQSFNMRESQVKSMIRNQTSIRNSALHPVASGFQTFKNPSKLPSEEVSPRSPICEGDETKFSG